MKKSIIGCSIAILLYSSIISSSTYAIQPEESCISNTPTAQSSSEVSTAENHTYEEIALLTSTEDNISTNETISEQERKESPSDEEQLDDWMPDQALQELLAKTVGANIEDIKTLSISEFVERYDPWHIGFNLSTKVKSLEGLDKLVQYQRDQNKYVIARTTLDLPDSYTEIMNYLNELNYESFGKIIEEYTTEYTENGGVNQPGIITEIADSVPTLSESLSSFQIVQLFQTLANKLGQTQQNYFSVKLNVTFNVNQDNSQSFVISQENLGLSELQLILKYPNAYSSVRGSGLFTLNVDGNVIEYQADEKDWPNWIETPPLNQPAINFSLQTPVDYESLAGHHGELMEVDLFQKEFIYLYGYSDTVALPSVNVIPSLNFLKQGGDITVTYLDEAGNKIAEEITLVGYVGDDFSTEIQEIEGYTFKEVKGNPSGLFTDQPQRVTYIYTQNKDEPIISPPSNLPKDGNDLNPSSSLEKPAKRSSATAITSDYQSLPATGEKNSRLQVMIGSLLIIGTILYASFHKKTLS